MPVVRSGYDDGIQVFAVQHEPVISSGLRKVALFLFFLDALCRFSGMAIIDVGDGDDFDVGLLEEGIEQLIAPTSRADQSEPDLVIGRSGREHGRPEQAGCPGRDSHRFHEIAPRKSIGRHLVHLSGVGLV